MLYSLENVKRSFGARTVLNISELFIEPEKIYTLIGPNGAGKTTLINILAFLDKPDSGKVDFKSQHISFTDKKVRLLRQRVVLVDQYPILFTAPVWKNIEFGLKIRGIAKNKRLQIVDEALEMVGMQEFKFADAHKLSGGETKRIALARALAIRPEVLICDEPTANVDVENQEIILNILERCNRKDKLSLIFATHYLSQAQRLADHSIILQNGRLSGNSNVNVFSAQLDGETEHGHIWKIGGQNSLIIEKTATLPLDKAKIFIDPKKILLCESTNLTTESRNCWTGKVCKVEKENGNVRVTLDVGVRLDILLEKQDYIDRPFYVEQSIRLEISEDAIIFI